MPVSSLPDRYLRGEGEVYGSRIAMRFVLQQLANLPIRILLGLAPPLFRPM